MEGVSPSHVSLTSEDIKPHIIRERGRVQELCESRGGRPGLLAPNSSYGLCGRKATLNSNSPTLKARSCVKVEVAVLGSPSSH